MTDNLQIYTLRIDGPLLRKQREALFDLLHTKLAKETWERLHGILDLLDEIADQAHDNYGIDCLVEDLDEGPGDGANVKEPGHVEL